MLTIFTFGDSILDCSSYNDEGITPGWLLANELSRYTPTRLVHRALDGATSKDLVGQVHNLSIIEHSPSLALVTIGGNDLLQSLLTNEPLDVDRFERRVDEFLKRLPVDRILLGTIYDPTFGNDEASLLGIVPTLGREALQRMNAALGTLGTRYGILVDLHAHFLGGDASWFSHQIEPSAVGAREIARLYLRALVDWFPNLSRYRPRCPSNMIDHPT
jgi:acyl-CoA thioesterase-1